MSGRVNDFSTWGYMVRAGRGDFRPAQEPLSEPTWALCTSTWALQTDLGYRETSKRLPGPILERFRTPLGGPGSPKNTVKYDVFAVSHVSPQATPRSSKSALGGSQHDPQEAPRSGPGRPRRPPRRLQERHKHPKSAAQTRLPSGLGGQVGPNWHKRAVRRPSKGHFGPPAGRFCILRGSIFVQFSSLGKHRPKLSSGHSLRKPTPSTALPPCVTSTCGLVRRRTANHEIDR